MDRQATPAGGAAITQPNAGEIQRFFELLYPDVEDGFLILSHPAPSRLTPQGKPVLSSDWFNLSTTTWQAIARTGQNLADKHSVYFGIALQRPTCTPAEFTRSKNATAYIVPGLWFDLDLAYGQHAASTLPATDTEALDFLHTLPAPPSFIVHSGGGMYGYWLFKEPYVIATETEHQAITQLSKQFTYTLTTAGKARGWTLDALGDLARVLRPSGTINHKYGKLVEVLCEGPERYNPSEFDWLLDLPTPARTTYAGTTIAGQPDLVVIAEHYGATLAQKSQAELAGPHPHHGSSTGDNFNVCPSKGLWHCWRHGTGGDALSLIAVCEGLLPCEDARAGALHGDLFKLAVGLANHKFQAGIQLGPSLLVGTQPAPTPPFDWELPTPFDEGQLPAFPVEVLPSWLAEYVQALAHATQTPTDLAGLLGLAAVATAMAQKVRVEVRQGYSEPVNVFVVAAMPPGSRKSPVFEGMMRPIQTHEEARMRQSAADIAKAETRYNIAKGELQQLQAKASKEENAVERMRLTEEAETLSAKLLTLLPPEKPRLVTDDTTPERLASLLAAQ